jgi:hypothetical protein
VITAVPIPTPVTTPDELTVAMEELLLLQTPPLTLDVNVVVPPTQIEEVPVITGVASTKRGYVTKLVPTVYVTVTKPLDMPVTTPVEVIVATAVLLVLQVPPGVASCTVVEDPTQILSRSAVI